MKIVNARKTNLAATLRSMDWGDVFEVSFAEYSENSVRYTACVLGRQLRRRYVVNAIYDENKIKVTRVQ